MTLQPYFSAAAGARWSRRRRVRTVPTATKVPSGRPGRSIAHPALLSGLAAALAIAFVYAPRLLAASAPGGGFSDQRSLIAALRDAFVGYWGSGSRDFSPAMQHLVDYWFRYHVAKAAIAALLLVVLTALAVVMFRAYVRAETGRWGRAAASASGGAVAAFFALCAMAVVAANIQGAVAPFASLLSMVPAARPDAPLTATVGQVKHGLAHYSTGAHTSPTLEGMVGDFALYHAALVIVAAIMTVALVAVGVVARVRFARSTDDRRSRRAFAALGLASIASSLVVIVIALINASTARDPAPALLAVFQGGR